MKSALIYKCNWSILAAQFGDHICVPVAKDYETVFVEALQERWIRVIAKCNYILASAVTLAATISR